MEYSNFRGKLEEQVRLEGKLMTDNFKNLIEILNNNFSDNLIKNFSNNNELTIIIEYQSIKNVVEFLFENKEFQFKSLIDITAVDFIRS